jgi:hypothetical protein
MEADFQEPVALPPSEDHSSLSSEDSIAWVNIFYGILIAPATTFRVLSNPDMYKTNSSAVLGAVLTFCLCSLVDGFAQGALNNGQPLGLLVAVTFVSDFLLWLLLAVLLSAWARWMKIEAGFWSAFVVTGWAFVPMVFKAPVVCYNALGDGWAIFLVSIPLIWFFILELLAFDAILKLGKAKTLAIIFVAPAVVFFACLFWFIIWAMIASNNL